MYQLHRKNPPVMTKLLVEEIAFQSFYQPMFPTRYIFCFWSSFNCHFDQWFQI